MLALADQDTQITLSPDSLNIQMVLYVLPMTPFLKDSLFWMMKQYQSVEEEVVPIKIVSTNSPA